MGEQLGSRSGFLLLRQKGIGVDAVVKRMLLCELEVQTLKLAGQLGETDVEVERLIKYRELDSVDVVKEVETDIAVV